MRRLTHLKILGLLGKITINLSKPHFVEHHPSSTQKKKKRFSVATITVVVENRELVMTIMILNYITFLFEYLKMFYKI